MNETRRRRKRPEPWNFVKHGTYGKFVTGGSIPIEYIQTSFRPDDLSRLTLARDVSQDDLDFEILMQRDLDEDRAELTLTKYLNPLNSSSSGIGLHSVFFPPLLIACIPTSSRKILHQYPDEEHIYSEDGTKLVRKWGEMFQLEFFIDDPVESYNLEISNENEPINIDTTDVEAKFRISLENERGIKLIAIDGQHRLWALRHLCLGSKDVVSDLVVPVCILFATSTSAAISAKYSERGIDQIPNVPQTFRKMFVDVNSKAESVGAHTNILLDDMNVGSLIIREFCDFVNKNKKFGLSCVEWNVKSSKDAWQLTRDYSITSVGILVKALRECFKNRSSLMNRVLDIQDATVRKNLLDAADDPDYPKVEWERFSIAQRKILVERVQQAIVPVLFKIFFESDPYKNAYDAYEKEIVEFEKKAEPNRDDASTYRQALDALLSKFGLPKKDTEAFIVVRDMGREEKVRRRLEICPLMDFALFQRAIFLTMQELMTTVTDASILSVGDAIVELLNIAMSPKLGLFGATRAYTRKSIWQESDRIVNKEQTRRQISRLLLGILGGTDACDQVLDHLDIEVDKKQTARENLMELGEDRAGEFLLQYRHESVIHYKRSFETNLALTEEEQDELRDARKMEEKETENIKSKKMAEQDAIWPFDRLVRQKLSDEFQKAEEELRHVLKYEKRIVGSETSTDDNGEDE